MKQVMRTEQRRRWASEQRVPTKDTADPDSLRPDRSWDRDLKEIRPKGTGRELDVRIQAT